MSAAEPRLLADLAAESGAAVPCAGNLPVEMDDPRFLWFVEQGAVDLFMVERRDGSQQSTPSHLLRADAGRLLPGVAPQQDDTTLGLVAKGLPGTVLRRLPADGLAGIGNAGTGGARRRVAQETSPLSCPATSRRCRGWT